jgi:hypothetical protein
MSNEDILKLKAQIKQLTATVEAATRFKRWALDAMAKSGLAFVKPPQEDYTNDVLTSDPNSCVCPFCGQIDLLKTATCDMQKCSACGHQMKKNVFSLPRWKGA